MIDQSKGKKKGEGSGNQSDIRRRGKGRRGRRREISERVGKKERTGMGTKGEKRIIKKDFALEFVTKRRKSREIRRKRKRMKTIHSFFKSV